MRWAYVVSGGPESTAFTPVPRITGAALGYKGAVVGQPGTQAIPAPYPGTLNDEHKALFTGGFSESVSMPPVWYPNLYYQSALVPYGYDVIAGNIQVFSHNQMPIPARDPRGVAAVLARPPKFMGTSQVTAKKVIPRWPDWLPTPAYGG